MIGARSMVGSRFCELQDDFELIKSDLDGEISLDITSQDLVNAFFQKYDFTTAILFSAYTNVDEAEKQRNDKTGLAWKINVQGAKNVASACRQNKRKLLLISTDFIFDGLNGPYTETEALDQDLEKISWYGLTKRYSESKTLGAGGNMVLRITYPYRAKYEQKKDFARNILERYEQNNLYPLFFDQITTPTFIDDIAPAIEILLKSKETGIFHLASPTSCTPYLFGQKLLKQFNKDPGKIVKSLLSDALNKEGTTPRPLRGGLKIEKLPKMGFVPTSWEDGIKKIFTQINDKLI